MWFKLYTNEVFRKREKIAITVVYYKYTTSSDLTILCSFMLRYYSIKETTVWYGNVYLYIQLLQLLEDLFGSYVYVARLGTISSNVSQTATGFGLYRMTISPSILVC